MDKVEFLDDDKLLSEFDDNKNCLQISNVFSDDKENSLHNSNVLSTTPFTEKGYEELDVSELNMKLRYSVTPASSPMSQSYTANCMLKENVDANNLNNTITKDNLLKSTKIPLQALQTGRNVDDKNMSSLNVNKESNLTITVTSNDIDENQSLPSTSSSTVQTPEATTPTKEIPKTDGGSPIMRGLKSVLNMFMPSYTPTSSETLPICEDTFSESTVKDDVSGIRSASTPIANCKIKDNSSKRSSPLKESVIFNNDLERELQWKDDTTINFKEEKSSIHKALLQTVSSDSAKELGEQAINTSELNTTIVYADVTNLDVSYKSSVEDRPADIDPKVVLNSEVNTNESDSEFLDCETIYSKNESYLLESDEKFHKIMPLLVDTSQIALEGYVEDDINTTIYIKDNYNTAESVVPIVESESNHSVSVILEAKDSTCVSDIKLKDDFINLPIGTNILANAKESSIPHLNDVNKSLQMNIQTFDLLSDLSDQENLNSSQDINNISTMANSDKQRNKYYNEVQSIEKSIESELNENMSYIEPMEHTVPTSDINETSISSNDIHASISIEDTKPFPDIIQRNESQELCVNKYSKTNDKTNENGDKNPRNNDTEMILECQKSKYSTNSIIENNITLEFLDQPDTYLSNMCTTDSSSNNNESIIECETDTKVLNATFISEDFIHSTNSQEINIKEKQNVCEKVSIMPKDLVNEIKENVLLNKKLTSTGVSKDCKDIFLNERYNIDTNRIQKNNSIELKDINSLQKQSSENYFESTKEGLTILMETQNEKIVNNMLHVIYDPDFKTIDKLDISNANCDDKSFNLKNMGLENANQQSNNKGKITVLDCEIELDTLLTSKECILDPKNNSVSDEDITMNTLDTESCGKNINHIQSEMGYRRLEKDAKFQLLELKNSLPSDIPLPNDGIENKRLIDGHSTKINNINICDGITKMQIEISSVKDKINSKFHDCTIQSNLLQQTLNEVSLLTEKIQSNCNQIIPESELLAKSNEDLLQQTKEITNTDLTSKVVTLPDIIQAASEASEKETVDVQKTLTKNISNSSKAIEDNVKIVKEEILMSINNSQYVQSSDMPTEKLHNKIELKTNKEGYNINFDEIDNPFATKTNIRMSPPPETLIKTQFTFETNEHQNIENINSVCTVDVTDIACLSLCQNISQYMVELPAKSDADMNDHSTISKSLSPDSKKDIKLLVEKTEKNNTLVGKHLDGENSKSVFNLPEIDASDFNPFKTMRDPEDTILSENNNSKTDSTCGTVDQIKPVNAMCDEDNIYYDKDLSIVSSIASNLNSDEVHTEDEDTIEGPFIETEDLAEAIKVSEIEVEKDMMQFKDLPTPLNNEGDVNGELFIDAETFDFLLNQNNSNFVVNSGKESLFLKFDPLFAKKLSSDGVLAALGSIQKKQSTPNKLTLIPSESVALEQTFDVSTVEPSSEANNALVYLNEIGNSICKPMMVVNPAINSNVTPKKSTTYNFNRGSSTFTSPAMLVIDSLLSQSDNITLLDQDDLMPHISKSHDASIALTQLREHLAEKQVHVHNLKCETEESRERLFTLESQVKTLENEHKERLRRINDLNEHLIEKTKSNKTMAAVVEEYERTIATLMAEKEQERRQNAKERAKLINERDEQTAHLISMERSISDLHSKYEKSRQTVLSMKANEDSYKKPLKEFDDNFVKMQKNYEQLKQYATSKLNSANHELDEINRAHQKEVAKLTAMIKCKNLHVTTLQESLTQKIKVNEKLTAICDELINRVG